MADRYTSRIALVLDRQVDSVAAVIEVAGKAGDIDRASAVRNEPAEAMEVHWGGRMDKGVVRRVTDDDGAFLLRTEAYIGANGLVEGMRRQCQLLQGLARHVDAAIVGVRDLTADRDCDEAWMNRLAIGAVEQDDAVHLRSQGEGVWWVRTHGAARFNIPDLELYGLRKDQVDGATAALPTLVATLLAQGLKADLALLDGTPVYLVPVLEAWQHLNLDWPGVGRAGKDRGRGLDGPRATLSLLHKPRLGRYRKDFKGVAEHL